MRRWASIAAFALVLALPLWGQRGGGHASGGHAGFGGGHSGGHFSGGMHGGSGFSHAPSSRGFGSRGLGSRGFSSQRGFSSRRSNHFRGRGPIITNGFRRGRGWGFNRWGYNWGYPWWYSGFYDPYWWWDSGSSYDEDYERDRDRAERMNAESLEQQRMWRQEEADHDQDAYAPPRRAPQTDDSADKSSPILPATVLVFRDQHKQEVQNYAIVGQTLWNFAPQRTQKIALSDLDLQATVKANDDQGVTFRVPPSNEAQ